MQPRFLAELTWRLCVRGSRRAGRASHTCPPPCRSRFSDFHTATFICFCMIVTRIIMKERKCILSTMAKAGDASSAQHATQLRSFHPRPLHPSYDYTVSGQKSASRGPTPRARQSRLSRRRHCTLRFLPMGRTYIPFPPIGAYAAGMFNPVLPMANSFLGINSTIHL